MDFGLRPQLSFVTVVFRKELPVIALQAASMAKFLPYMLCSRIIIVINDLEEEEVCRAYIYKTVLPLFEHLAGRVTVISSDLLFKHNGQDGYFTQQLSKLYVSNFIREEYYVCLDSKNFFVNQVTLDTFFEKARPRGTFEPYQEGGYQLNVSQEYSSFFNIKEVTAGESGLWTATPFVFQTALVKSLLCHIAHFQGQQLTEVFPRFKLHSEFMLYSTYLRRICIDANTLYWPSEPLSFTVWRKSHIGVLVKSIRNAGAAGIPLVGLHRERITEMTLDEVAGVCNHLRELLFDTSAISLFEDHIISSSVPNRRN